MAQVFSVSEMKINHICQACTRYRNRTWLYRQRRQALSVHLALQPGLILNDRRKRLTDVMFELLVAKLNGDLLWLLVTDMLLMFLQYYVSLYSCVLDWFWWCLFVKIEDFFLDFLLRFFWFIMFMLCSIRCMCAASNDCYYFFIFHRMLTATEQNMYFDYATMLCPKSNCNCN